MWRKGRRRKPQVRCQSEPKGYGQRHHVRFDSSPHQDSGSLPDKAGVTVVPAEIIKMPALEEYPTRETVGNNSEKEVKGFVRPIIKWTKQQ